MDPRALRALRSKRQRSHKAVVRRGVLCAEARASTYAAEIDPRRQQTATGVAPRIIP